jgi:hypothetical protein
VHLSWSFRYRCGEDDRVYALDETRGIRGIRRPDAEQALVAALDLDEEQRLRLCGSTRQQVRLLPEQTFHGAAAIAFAEDTLAPLEASAQLQIEEIGARPDYHELTDAPVVRFQPRHGGQDTTPRPPDAPTDWLDLEVVISIGDRFIGLAQLIEAMTLGAERIILRDGAHLRIDRPELARLTELVREARELTDQPREGVRVGHHDLGLWAELAEIGLVDEQAARWVGSAVALRDVQGLPDIEPEGVTADLRSYQRDGFRWLVLLWRLRLGGILADDMGLGKTLQTLALVAHARDASPGDGPFLVVAPTSVVATWASEAAAFTPGLVVRTVTESRARRGASLASVRDGADVVITSYTLFRLEADDYVDLDWAALVLDEAQTVKNHQGKTYQAVRRLDVPFRLALTGTPLENRLMELWSLLSIVAPGLYPYPQRFVEAVANPVEKEGDASVLDRFRRRVRPFLLRRTKDLVASDLPSKQEQVLEVRLTPRHRKIYETHLQRERQNVLGLLGEFDKRRMAIFRSLTRLRQLSLDAALVEDRRARGPPRGDRRRGSPGTGVQPVHVLPRPGPRPARRRGDHLEVPRRPHPAARGRRGRLQAGRGLGVPHQPQGRRRGADAHRGRLRLRAGPVVEPGRGGAGRRPRPPHRPNPAGDRLPAGRPGHHRAEGHGAQGAQGRALRPGAGRRGRHGDPDRRRRRAGAVQLTPAAFSSLPSSSSRCVSSFCRLGAVRRQPVSPKFIIPLYDEQVMFIA